MTMRRIQHLVENGRYFLGPHALAHGLEEGFEKEQCIGAILGGRIIEDYPAERRCLVYGRFHVTTEVLCPLHVVLDYSNYQQVRIVTAYIPRPPVWVSPWRRAAARR